MAKTFEKSLPKVQPSNSLVSVDGMIFKVQKKRQRKIHSCIPCHQRKIGCSRETPTCSNCLKLAEKNPEEYDHVIGACKYFDNDKKKNLRKKGVQLDDLNLLPFNSISGSSPVNSASFKQMGDQTSSSHDESIDSYTPISSHDRQRQLSSQCQSPPKSKRSIVDNQQIESQLYKQRRLSFAQEEHEGVPPEKNNIATNSDFEDYGKDLADRPKDHSNLNIHSQYNFDEIQSRSTELPNFDIGINSASQDSCEGSEFTYSLRSHSNPYLNSKSASSPQQKLYPENNVHSYYANLFSSQFIHILEALPTKKRSDELLRNFHTSIFPILPILDFKYFLEKYNEFWYCGLFLTDNIEKLYQYNMNYRDTCENEIPEKIRYFSYWYNKTKKTLNPTNLSEFLILLFAIYYTSISTTVYEYLSLKNDGMNDILPYKNEVNRYYNTFKKMNHKGLSNPRVMSLAVLQINVLIQSVINLKSGSSLMNITQIIRICQFYQLNRDPVYYHDLNDTEIVQIRRILWWQVLFLDSLVSFFLNLTPSVRPSGFDIGLLLEKEETGRTDYCSVFENCINRYILVIDELNTLTNGLNSHLNNEDIARLKRSIRSLFISVNSARTQMAEEYNRMINNGMASHTDFSILEPSQFQSQIETTNSRLSIMPGLANFSELNQESNFQFINIEDQTSPLCLHLYLCCLNIITDKVLIMLHKKLLISSYIISKEDDQINPHLNLKLTSTSYTYTNLQTNLLPSLIHYLEGFLILSKRELAKFNWKLKNYIPIDELYLLMQILATNFKLGATQLTYDQFNDINMKVYLIDQTINSMKINWHLKLSSVNKLISLASNLWELMILKYNINLETAYSVSPEFNFPQPVIESNDPYTSTDELSTVDTAICTETYPFIFNNASARYFITDTKTSNTTPRIPSDVRRRPFFQRININPTYNESMDVKEKFIAIAKLIEVELLKETNTGAITETNEEEEGWYKLGTEDEFETSIDDFHFYKNLKADVVRLFKSTIR